MGYLNFLTDKDVHTMFAQGKGKGKLKKIVDSAGI